MLPARLSGLRCGAARSSYHQSAADLKPALSRTYRQPSPLPICTHALTKQESREAGEPEKVREQAHPVATRYGLIGKDAHPAEKQLDLL